MVAIDGRLVEQQQLVGVSAETAAHTEHLLAHFDPISLAEMEHVSLLNRTDTKFVLRVSQLHHVLRQLTEYYQVLDINHTRLNHYQTLYFDTRDFALYRQHHDGLRVRYKVRVREYVDSDLAFWEIKRKTNQERTVKYRLQTPEPVTEIEEPVGKFIDTNTPFHAQELEPKLWNRFLRMTLVSKDRPERLTLDLNMEFGWGAAYATLPGIVVAEVKQERSSSHSDFIRQMRQLSIRPNQFSKYCTGVYMLYDHVKTNNFKVRMRLVEKLIQEEMIYEYTH